MEFQKYTLMQEDRLEECKALLDDICFPPDDEEEQEYEEEEEETEADENSGEVVDERSFSKSSSISTEYDDKIERSEYEQGESINKVQDKSPMPDEASRTSLPHSPPSPVQKHQYSRIPRPTRPPRATVMLEDGKKNTVTQTCERSFSKSSSIPTEYEGETEGSEYKQGESIHKVQDKSPMSDEASSSPSLSPVQKRQYSRIPRPTRRTVMSVDVKKKGLTQTPKNVFSQSRVANESKVESFQEKLPNCNKAVRSTGYDRNTNQASVPFAQNPQVILPSHAKVQQLHSNDTSQDSMQYDESIFVKISTVKEIVKPNLKRKDLMKLKDLTTRPRVKKQTAGILQEEVVVGNCTRCQQELVLPMIPQPPSRAINEVTAYTGSRIPRLPTIQRSHGMSGIPRPCPPVQPKVVSRLRPRASHRRYVARETALPFPRGQ